MMTPFEEQFLEYQEKSSFCLKSGNEHREKGDVHHALELFLLAMQHYQMCLYAAERLEISSSIGNLPYYEPETKLNVLKALTRMSMNIATCYFDKDDTEKASYFISFLDEIANALGELKAEFDFNLEEAHNQLLKNILLLKSANSIKNAEGVEPDPGFLSKENASANEEYLDSIAAYYKEQFDKTVKAIEKIRSLHISSLCT